MPPKKAKATAATTSTDGVVTAETKPKAQRKVRVSKKAIATADPPLPVQSIVTTTPTMVETMAPPIVPYEVIKVKIKKVRLEGKEYFLSPTNGKVYSIGSHGMPASYRGRYVAATEESSAKLDASYPDSDAECD